MTDHASETCIECLRRERDDLRKRVQQLSDQIAAVPVASSQPKWNRLCSICGSPLENALTSCATCERYRQTQIDQLNGLQR